MSLIISLGPQNFMYWWSESKYTVILSLEAPAFHNKTTIYILTNQM